MWFTQPRVYILKIVRDTTYMLHFYKTSKILMLPILKQLVWYVKKGLRLILDYYFKHEDAVWQNVVK